MKRVALIANIGNRNLSIDKSKFIPFQALYDWLKINEISEKDFIELNTQKINFKETTKFIYKHYEWLKNCLKINILLATVNEYITHEEDHVYLIGSNQGESSKSVQDTIFSALIIERLLIDQYSLPLERVHFVELDVDVTHNDSLLKWNLSWVYNVIYRKGFDRVVFLDSGGSPAMKSNTKRALEFIFPKEKVEIAYASKIGVTESVRGESYALHNHLAHAELSVQFLRSGNVDMAWEIFPHKKSQRMEFLFSMFEHLMKGLANEFGSYASETKFDEEKSYANYARSLAKDDPVRALYNQMSKFSQNPNLKQVSVFGELINQIEFRIGLKRDNKITLYKSATSVLNHFYIFNYIHLSKDISRVFLCLTTFFEVFLDFCICLYFDFKFDLNGLVSKRGLLLRYLSIKKYTSGFYPAGLNSFNPSVQIEFLCSQKLPNFITPGIHNLFRGMYLLYKPQRNGLSPISSFRNSYAHRYIGIGNKQLSFLNKVLGLNGNEYSIFTYVNSHFSSILGPLNENPILSFSAEVINQITETVCLDGGFE